MNILGLGTLGIILKTSYQAIVSLWLEGITLSMSGPGGTSSTVDTSCTAGSSGTVGLTNTAGPNVNSDLPYWQDELKLSLDALSALNKNPVNWTQYEKLAAEAYKKINQFNKNNIENSIKIHSSNIKTTIRESN